MRWSCMLVVPCLSSKLEHPPWSGWSAFSRLLDPATIWDPRNSVRHRKSRSDHLPPSLTHGRPQSQPQPQTTAQQHNDPEGGGAESERIIDSPRDIASAPRMAGRYPVSPPADDDDLSYSTSTLIRYPFVCHNGLLTRTGTCARCLGADARE